MDIASHLKQLVGSGIKEHEVLRSYTSLKIGGVADFFYEAHTIEDLVKSVQAAGELNLPYLIIGGGSQLLISDYGFPGLVIRNLTSRISFIPEQSQLIADSGVSTARLVMEAASRDMGGIEFLATLQSSVGGAVYANQGNFGFAVGSFVRSATIFEPPDGLKTYQNDWLKSGYLTTRLKTDRLSEVRPPVILTVKLQLQRYKKEEIMRKISYFRKRANSGFMLFKNPSGQATRLTDDPDVTKKSASEVLKCLGAANINISQARLDPSDPNYLINKGKAKAADIRLLVDELKKQAAEREGVLLEEAFEYVGKWE